jgi:hypothetical protein
MKYTLNIRLHAPENFRQVNDVLALVYSKINAYNKTMIRLYSTINTPVFFWKHKRSPSYSAFSAGFTEQFLNTPRLTLWH